jgi:dihydrofolate reductase
MGTSGGQPIWTALNTQPKYVASTTMSDPQWADTSVLSGDIAAAVGELKAKPGRERQVHGRPFSVAARQRLVDEMTLFIFPLLVGQGARLLPDTGRDRRSSWSNRGPPERSQIRQRRNVAHRPDCASNRSGQTDAAVPNRARISGMAH